MSSGFAITSYDGLTPAIGVLSAQSESISEFQNPSIVAPKTTLEVNQDRYNLFLKPVQNIDDQLVKKLDSINNDKQIIADTATHSYWLSNKQTYGSESAARSAAESLFGDTLTSSEGMTRLVMAPTLTGGSVAAGIALTQINGASGTVAITQSYSGGSAFEIIVKSVSGAFGIGSVFGPVGVITNCTSTDFVGTGQIYDDNVILTYYPNLEPANTGTENPLQPENLIPLTGSNEGLGVANTFYKNSLTSPGSGPVPSEDLPSGVVHTTSSAPSSKGTVFAYSGSNSTVDNQISDINTKRNDLDDPNASSNVIKGDKKGYATNVWMISKSDSNLAQRQTDIATAVQILQDPTYGGPY